MASFELRVKPSVGKDLRGLPRPDVERILARIQALREDPRPPGCERLSGQARYRVRQCDYRILYTVCDAAILVEIVKVANRREVYRGP